MTLQAAKEIPYRKINVIPGASRLPNEATMCRYLSGRVSGQPLPSLPRFLYGELCEEFPTKCLRKYFLFFLNEEVLQKTLLEIYRG